MIPFPTSFLGEFAQRVRRDGKLKRLHIRSALLANVVIAKGIRTPLLPVMARPVHVPPALAIAADPSPVEILQAARPRAAGRRDEAGAPRAGILARVLWRREDGGGRTGRVLVRGRVDGRGRAVRVSGDEAGRGRLADRGLRWRVRGMSPRGCEGSRAGRVLRPGGAADGGGFVLLCLTTAVLRTELVLRLQRLPLTDASCAFAPRIVTWDLEHSAPDLLNPTAKNQDRKRLPKVDGQSLWDLVQYRSSVSLKSAGEIIRILCKSMHQKLRDVQRWIET
ncbi:hypothetical protein CCMA1212_008289 [Trichoderma ghanense]|uniref:Uncharacterized protein n=1 Tax=Trichoderma ghanense TaxID=65468 RepID=A0ABY2GY99_9HYPO